MHHLSRKWFNERGLLSKALIDVIGPGCRQLLGNSTFLELFEL